jgi:hypothetical protein
MESINVVVEDIPSDNQKKLVTLGENDELIQVEDKIGASEDVNTEIAEDYYKK